MATPLEQAIAAAQGGAASPDLSPLEQAQADFEQFERERKLREKEDRQFLAGQDKTSPIDKTRGAAPAIRGVAGLPFTQKGAYNALVARLGGGNVRAVGDLEAEDARIFVRQKSTEAFRELDPQDDASLGAFIRDIPGDLADLSGEAIETGAGIVGSVLGATKGGAEGAVAGGVAAGPPGAIVGGISNAATQGKIGGMAGDIAGTFLRAGARETFAPGSDEDVSLMGRAGFNAMSGLVGGEVAERGIKTIQKLAPTKLFTRTLLGERTPQNLDDAISGGGKTGQDAVAEGVELERKIQQDAPEFNFSGGELTGGRSATRLESFLRQTMPDIWTEADFARAKNLGVFLDRVVDTAARGAGDIAQAPQRIADATKLKLKDMVEMRGKVFTETGLEIQRLTGGARDMPIGGYLETVEQWIGKLDTEGAGLSGGAREKLRGMLMSTRDRIIGAAEDAADIDLPFDPTVSAKAFNNIMSDLYAKMSGEEHFIPEAVQLSEAVAGDLLGALNRDLDGIARAGGVSGDAAKMLQDARKGWGIISQEMGEIKSNVLIKVLDGMGLAGSLDNLPKKVLNWSPQQIKSAFNLVREMDPDAANALRASVLENMLVDSQASAGSELAKTAIRKAGQTDALPDLPISPQKFASLILKDKNADRLRAIFADDPTVIAKLAQAAQAASRVSDRLGTNTSGTAVWEAYAKRFMLAGVKGLVSPVALGKEMALIFTAKRLSIALNHPATRNLALGVIRGEHKTAQALLRAAVQLNLRLDRETNIQSLTQQKREPDTGLGARPASSASRFQ